MGNDECLEHSNWSLRQRKMTARVFLSLQAWTNMVLTVLNQVLILSDSAFLTLQPALYPCLSQLSCHVTDVRVRQALCEWLGRIGRLYDIIL